MLTGRVVKLGEDKGAGPAGILKRLVARSGEPFIRQALRQAMRILGDNFVLGRTIEEALGAGRALRGQGLPLLLRHAGRARQDRRGRRALFRALHGGDRGDRRGQARAPQISTR